MSGWFIFDHTGALQAHLSNAFFFFSLTMLSPFKICLEDLSLCFTSCHFSLSIVLDTTLVVKNDSNNNS